MIKKLIIILFIPLLSTAQIAPELIHLKPVFTKTAIFDYTGSDQQWIVPTGVTNVFIDVFGAQGGNSASAFGGKGGKVRAIINVTPGETLLLIVGGQPNSNITVYGGGGNGGVNSFDTTKNGLAGGGLSGVYRNEINLSNSLLIAGGGGGAGGDKPGGFGGGNIGGNNELRCGYGGTQTTGGAIGEFLDTQALAPTIGASLQGGTGGNPSQNSHSAGGGGGGGFFGGGGGVAGGAGVGSGGGGSSWALPTLTKIATMPNFNSGHGRIIIYYN